MDIYLKEHPESKSNTFYWIKWEANTVYPESWEWAYISPSSLVEELKNSSNCIPIQECWGQNIIEIEWEIMELQ